MDTRETLIITSDDDAIKLLMALHSHKINGKNISLELREWPNVSVHVQGEQFDSTITPPLMNGFIELQKAVYKSYALLKYNDSGKRLTAAEKSELELVVKVGEGSSDLIAKLEEPLKVFLKEMADMESGHKLLAIVTCALVLAGSVSYSNYLETRKEERKLDLETAKVAEAREVRIAELNNVQFMSGQETDRMKALTEIIKAQPQIRVIQDLAYEANTEILKGAATAVTANIQGKEISGGMAEELKRNAPKKRTEDTISGEFSVVNVDASKSDKYWIKLTRSSDDLTVKVSIPHDFTEDNAELRDTIKDAEWAQTPVYCVINVRRSGTEITRAELVSAEARGVLAKD